MDLTILFTRYNCWDNRTQNHVFDKIDFFLFYMRLSREIYILPLIWNRSLAAVCVKILPIIDLITDRNETIESVYPPCVLYICSRQAVGRPVMPPYWALGFSLAKFGYGHINSMKDNIQRMKDMGIPQVSWFYVDVFHQIQLRPRNGFKNTLAVQPLTQKYFAILDVIFRTSVLR